MFKVFIAVLVVAGCAHMQDQFMQVHPGMDQATVTQILGAPEDRAFSNHRESWIYSYFSLGSNGVKIIDFENGKVVGLHEDELAQQRNHEIQRAEAGATKIQIGTTPHYGNGYHSFHRPCDQWNAFGHFPTGGGCNAFGCWPAGGNCSPFGCSLSGECGAVNCPDKVGKYDLPS